jgi:hypothetical protein
MHSLATYLGHIYIQAPVIERSKNNVKCLGRTEFDTYIHRLYLKHGKPSVILHNKYSLNYSKLKNIWIRIVYIYI